jgi:hypothetical protein
MEVFALRSSTRPPWYIWVGGAVLAAALWFGFLVPLVPETSQGIFIEALLPLPLLGYIYMAVRVLFWMADRNWVSGVRRLAAYAVASSVGLAAFGIVLMGLEIRKGNFGYWH